MIVRSKVSFDHENQKSTFTWFPAGEPRSIEYSGGRTTIPAKEWFPLARHLVIVREW